MMQPKDTGTRTTPHVSGKAVAADRVRGVGLEGEESDGGLGPMLLNTKSTTATTTREDGRSVVGPRNKAHARRT